MYDTISSICEERPDGSRAQVLDDIFLQISPDSKQHMILNDVKIQQKKELDADGEETNKVQNYISIGNIIFVGEKDGLNTFPENIQSYLQKPQPGESAENSETNHAQKS